MIKFLLIAVFLHKSHFWAKDLDPEIEAKKISANDCRIFKSTISPEQVDETASFFPCWYKFTKIKIHIFFWLGIVKNGSGQSALGTLKLNVSEEWNDEIDWFFCKLIQIHTN